MPKVNVDGVQIYYEVHGQGTPLVLIEGFASTTAIWHPQIPVLSRHCQLILHDLRGQGQSDVPQERDAYSVDHAVNDLYRLLRYLGIEQAVIGGISLGGYLSFHFYDRHPDMVKGLVIIDAGPGYRSEERRRQWARECEERAEIIERGGMHAFLHSAWAADDYYTPHVQMLRLDPVGVANVSRGIMSSASAVDILPRVQVPTLLICGEYDTGFLAATDYMAGKIPGARKVIIPDACHACHQDQPEIFNTVVLDFLAEIEAKGPN